MGLSSILRKPGGSVPGEIPDSLHRSISIERSQIDLCGVDPRVTHQGLERLQRTRMTRQEPRTLAGAWRVTLTPTRLPRSTMVSPNHLVRTLLAPHGCCPTVRDHIIISTTSDLIGLHRRSVGRSRRRRRETARPRRPPPRPVMGRQVTARCPHDDFSQEIESGSRVVLRETLQRRGRGDMSGPVDFEDRERDSKILPDTVDQVTLLPCLVVGSAQCDQDVIRSELLDSVREGR